MKKPLIRHRGEPTGRAGSYRPLGGGILESLLDREKFIACDANSSSQISKVRLQVAQSDFRCIPQRNPEYQFDFLLIDFF